MQILAMTGWLEHPTSEQTKDQLVAAQRRSAARSRPRIPRSTD